MKGRKGDGEDEKKNGDGAENNVGEEENEDRGAEEAEDTV